MTLIPALASTPVRIAILALSASLASCSSLNEMAAGDKIDYRSSSNKTAPLDIPPDLTQLARDGRYQVQQSGVVSASAMQQQQAANTGARAAAAGVAPSAIGNVRMERAGQQRYLVTDQAADQLWPRVRTFWLDSGFVIATENADTGVMETGWAENRAKIPSDFIRNTIGRVFDSLWSTSQRDKFRTRLERVPGGTEVYVSHRGMEEVFVGSQMDTTSWQARPSDPQLEAEMLSRLMMRLGVKEPVATAAVAATAPNAPPATPPRARALPDQPGAALQLDEPFDRAWRRVGLALDRNSFTVEDRDRGQGLYFVRYVDSKQASRDDPGLISKVMGIFGKEDTNANALARYRIAIKSTGDQSNVAILNNQGVADNSANAQRIVTLLVEELK